MASRRNGPIDPRQAALALAVAALSEAGAKDHDRWFTARTQAEREKEEFEAGGALIDLVMDQAHRQR
jgi:hypothetical protein